MGEIWRLLNNEGAFTTLRGNQRGITAGSFACSRLGRTGSQRERRLYERQRAHKVAFTVAALISQALSTPRTLTH